MNKPLLIIGSLSSVKNEVEKRSGENIETLTLGDSVTIDEIKNFRKFLITSGVKSKLGVIYFFNKLNDSKQAALLKIFEELPSDSNVIIHANCFVSFTIQSRCNVEYLIDQESSSDLEWINEFMFDAIKKNALSKKIMQGFEVYIEAISLYSNGFLSESEKNSILESLKG